MNLKALDYRWVLAFVAATTVGTIGVVLVLTLAHGGDERAVAQPVEPSATPLSTPTTLTAAETVWAEPTIPSTESYPVVVPELPKGFTQGEKRPCPEGWRRISDTVANYSFCLPRGWAILDAGSSEPSERTTMQFESAAILSPEGFPYPYAGSYEKGIRDLVRDSGKKVVWMQLIPYWFNDQNPLSMSCDAKLAEPVGGLPSASCENSFDIPSGTDKAVPDPSGNWHRLFVVVPLPGAKAPVDLETSSYPTPEGGYAFALGIIFEGRSDALAHHRDVIEQILATIEGQP